MCKVEKPREDGIYYAPKNVNRIRDDQYSANIINYSSRRREDY